MTKEVLKQTREIHIYLDHAHQMLQVAEYNLQGGFYASAVNRAYYAIFYAANALLITQGVVRSKHSGVLAAFRRHFVKADLIEAEYSDIYGRVMDNRHVSDYELELEMDPDVAASDLQDARRFVERIERYLAGAGWL